MSSPRSERSPRIVAIDAGGTMTDTIIIDADGQFVVGKAQTTPEDESIGFLNSFDDAVRYWQTDAEQTMSQVVSGIYSGTAMLNRLLERKGRRVGVIVTAGMEDYLRLERGIQTYLGYSYSDRIHLVTHRHNEPLVPRSRMKGATERVDVFGDVAIPSTRTRSARPRASSSPTASRRSASRSSSAIATRPTRCAPRRSCARCWPRRAKPCPSTAPRIATRCARTSRA